GAKSFHEHIGVVDHAQHQVDSLAALEVDTHCRAPPGEHLPTVDSAGGGGGHPDSLEPNDLGSEVGKDHGAERAGAESGELDDTQSDERSRGPSTRPGLIRCSP